MKKPTWRRKRHTKAERVGDAKERSRLRTFQRRAQPVDEPAAAERVAREEGWRA